MTAATDGDLPPWRQRLRGALKREGRQVSARWLQLATVTSDGTPRVRTLVFRGWNGADQLELYTDGRSSKIAELNHQPQVELCWLLTKAKQQYRLRGTAAQVAASPDQAQWRSLSPSGRALWGWPHPGQPFEPAAPFPQETPRGCPRPGPLPGGTNQHPTSGTTGPEPPPSPAPALAPGGWLAGTAAQPLITTTGSPDQRRLHLASRGQSPPTASDHHGGNRTDRTPPPCRNRRTSCSASLQTSGVHRGMAADPALDAIQLPAVSGALQRSIAADSEAVAVLRRPSWGSTEAAARSSMLHGPACPSNSQNPVQ